VRGLWRNLRTEDGEDMFLMNDWDPDRMMDEPYSGGMMSSWGVWMMVFLGLLLLILAGTAIFWALKAAGTTHANRNSGPAGSPRDLLDLRLAGGEISAEEYTTTRALLGP
jgi:uncharacterized membrane protein